MEHDKGAKISLLIKDVNNLMHQSIKECFDETGLTTPQLMVLYTLGKHGSMKLSDISEKLSISNSTISGIVDRLEKQKCVERIRSKEDRRVIYVSPCENSKKIMPSNVCKKIEDNLNKKLMKAKEGEIEAIINGLETLKALLKD
ncbi:MarR family winged helix-turn-helix transcriptional regulator [Clostridium colicanis]|uniref:Putative HTH-type transcriptional regulator YusO n=1 Tax=Clostridium colicanis DSM 13634 TaxID=1121305 RepID=A0A151AKH9_9CLOT|nr:MarR family transcriptional regulator [Clostridium colicanis]KYH28122.1 putative HTH-type transcriptional regulator YusO [Clostridium colicanis DSM 13634]